MRPREINELDPNRAQMMLSQLTRSEKVVSSILTGGSTTSRRMCPIVTSVPERPGPDVPAVHSCAPGRRGVPLLADTVYGFDPQFEGRSFGFVPPAGCVRERTSLGFP
jgi:hypothetical protein